MKLSAWGKIEWGGYYKRLIFPAALALALALTMGRPWAASAAGAWAPLERAGEFGPAQESQLISRLEAAFGPEARLRRSSAALAPEAATRCAAMVLRDLAFGASRLSPKARARWAPLLQRPSESETSSELPPWSQGGSYTESRIQTTHFIVHYVSAPSSHPAYATASFAQQVMDVVESAAAIENTTLAWPYPPADTNYPSGQDNGGDSRYDIYLGDVGALGYFGYVQPEYREDSAPGYAATSYMVLDNDYTNSIYGTGNPLDFLKATAAHEYNHACQYAYNANDSEDWFYETTATHTEDLVFNSINDYYRFLPDFFDAPDMSLRTSNGNFEYGACVWNHYLAANFGASFIREIWAGTATGGSGHPSLLTSMNAKLAARSTTLADEFGRFAAWNALTDTRGDPAYYPEGAAWPDIWIPPDQTHSVFPASSPATLSLPPEALAASYVLLTPPASQGRITFNFSGASGMTWRLWMVGRKGSQTVLENVALDSQNLAGTAVVDNTQQYSWIIFVPSAAAAAGSTGQTFNFTYSASWESTLSASNSYLIVE